MDKKSYWIAIEYPWPEGNEDPHAAVRAHFRRCAALARDTSAKQVTVYTDEQALKDAWEEQQKS